MTENSLILISIYFQAKILPNFLFVLSYLIYFCGTAFHIIKVYVLLNCTNSMVSVSQNVDISIDMFQILETIEM